MSSDDVYKKVGRGGAGNFYSAKDGVEVARAGPQQQQQDDVEAQRSPPRDHLSRVASGPRALPEYQHTGRGGAGNWVQPSELAARGLEQVGGGGDSAGDAAAAATANASKKGAVIGASKPSYRAGRGGAGNYVDAAGEERARKEGEERLRRETEERITRDVEAGLSRPPKAYGGRGGAFEMD